MKLSDRLLPPAVRSKLRVRPVIVAIARPLCCAALLGGCSALPQMTDPVASFGASNVFSKAGYDQTKLDDTHFKVTGTGTQATPKERVEKIARARAAQIGVEEHLKYFKVASVQHGVKCSKRQDGYKSEAMPAASYPTVVLEVVYAQEPADPGFASSVDAYAALTGELASEAVAPEAKAIAIQEARAGCGQG
jgi:hypothetical protein